MGDPVYKNQTKPTILKIFSSVVVVREQNVKERPLSSYVKYCMATLRPTASYLTVLF